MKTRPRPARDIRLDGETVGTQREVSDVELSGMIGSIAHLAHHLDAIRQISALARGPKEAMF